MAHLLKIVKVCGLKHRWKHYLEEKKIGLTGKGCDVQYAASSSSEERCWSDRLITKIKTPNTAENILALSITGFIGGVLLTYVFFAVFYIGISFSLLTTTCLCGLAGILFCLGLAFSSIVRCYVLLLLPALFSKQGRQALLAYALFLAFTGPARNTMHNLGILSDSMTCGQEMVKRTLRQIVDMTKTPFRSIKETIEKITKTLKKVVESLKTELLKFQRTIVDIFKVFKKAATWLKSKINFFNKKIGTPFQRCMAAFDHAIADCKAKLGILDFLCHVVHIVKALCYAVKRLDCICTSTEFVSDQIIELVKKKLRYYCLKMENLMYMSVEFSSACQLETVATNEAKEVRKTVLGKVRKKLEKFQSIFRFFGFAFSLILPFLFLKAYYYKYKYLSSDRYDNIYISEYIIDLDKKRAEMDRETVLPLERRERKIYGTSTSIRLLKLEKRRFTQSMFFLTLTTFKIITFLAIDYSLFWILLTIYEAGRDATEGVEKSKLRIHITGQGILANFYRNLGEILQVPENPNLHLTPMRCLPDPVQPDTRCYIQIGFLVALSWFLTLAEPYGLRLRSVVMSHYYPDRARERAVWLYNHILRCRGSFLRYARRRLRRRFCRSVQPIEKVTLSQRLFAGFPPLEAIFGKCKENNCLLCGVTENKKAPLKRCKTPDCQGRYDSECYAALGNVCTVCRLPIDYGDVSDITEEMDSSEEDPCNRQPYDSYSSPDSEGEKFLTFKQMELRDRFRDLEANKLTDYAKLGDLYQDKAALKQRLKEVLHRHIENAKKEKRVKIKESKYKVIKCKIKAMISNLKRRKSRCLRQRKSALRQKVAEKLDSLKNLQRNSADERENLLEYSKSGTSFRFDPVEDEAKLDYKMLKEKARAQIKKLKERKLEERRKEENANETSDCDDDSE